MLLRTSTLFKLAHHKWEVCSTCSGNSEVFEMALPMCWTLLEASRSPAFDPRGIPLLDLYQVLPCCKLLPFRNISESKAGFGTFAIQRVSASACTRAAAFQRTDILTVHN